MSKWKCEICDSEFENYHAQGFEHKIYCPLCYFKELNNRKNKEIEHLQNLIDKTTNYYLKTLAKNGSMPDEAVEMYNLLEENKR